MDKIKIMNGHIILLASVGTGLDPVSGMTFPALKGGGFDTEAGVHLNDCTKEWVDHLSPTDKSIVGEVMVKRVAQNNREALLYRQRLPMYTYRGMEYFVDFRLEELRPSHEPFKSYPFTMLNDEQMKAELRGLRAEFYYPYYMEGLDND